MAKYIVLTVNDRAGLRQRTQSMLIHHKAFEDADSEAEFFVSRTEDKSITVQGIVDIVGEADHHMDDIYVSDN